MEPSLIRNNSESLISDLSGSPNSTFSSFNLSHSAEKPGLRDRAVNTETETRDDNANTLPGNEWLRAGINRNPVYNLPVMGNEFPTQYINAPCKTKMEVNDFDPTLIDKRNITVRRKRKVNSRGVFVNQHPKNDQLLLDKRRTCSRDRSNAD